MADFATVTELEAFMGTSGLGTRGTAMLTHASAAIRAYTRQDIEATAGRQEEWAGEWNRYYLEVLQKPITALTSITIDAVAFTDFWSNFRDGTIWRNDEEPWDTGPIIVTYDSGYASGSDEIAVVKLVCLEVAARALAGPPETFGLEVQEVRGAAPGVYLTAEERSHLDQLTPVGVG